MFDRRFRQTQLGRAAMLSVAAMVSFNILALAGQLHAAPTPALFVAHAA